MATIDDKVVAMSFENSKFESGVAQSISSLDKLKAALHFPKASTGLDDLNKSGSRVDLSHISRGIEEITSRLNALRLTAIAVFSNIVSHAISAGTSLVKALSLDPLKQGLQEYETQINAVQVILGNTSAAGVKIKDVNKALDELNTYADKTIYNFGQMTKNVGTFTAAGVDLKTSVSSIKGIANMAALSGSTAEQASTAMYQLSQAISSGKVALIDWKSVENASMGSATFKRALAETAIHMGTLKENTVKMIGPMKNIKINGESFRQSLAAGPGKESWLTSDVLTTTLKQLSGDMTDAQLKAKGYSDAQIKNIQQMAQTALSAATTVKTFTQLVSTTKEQLGTGWASSFKIVVGDFEEAKALFTDVSHAIGGFVGASANARNKVLQDWKDLGGRTLLIDSIRLAFHNLGLVLAPIKEAFRDIFPAKTGKDLMNLTVMFAHFAEALKPSKETVEDLKRTFRGLFALMDIGKMIITGIFSVFGHLFGVMGKGSGGFLEFTGNIGDFLVKLDETLKKGNKLQKFFDKLAEALEVPLHLIAELAGSLKGLFKFNSKSFSSQIDGATGSLSIFSKILKSIGDTFSSFMSGMGDMGDIWGPVAEAMGKGVRDIGLAIGTGLSQMSFEPILQVIRTGLMAGLVVMFKSFLGKGSAIDQITKGFGGGILSNISGSFKALQGSMVAMQQNVKADTLKKIAVAVALLAASLLVLSLIDPKKMTASLTAMTVAFGELLGAMVILGNISTTTGFLKIPFIAGSLILLAGAMVVLSLAVSILAQLSWSELLKGLAGTAVLLEIIIAAAKPLAANAPGLISAGLGITALAIGLRIMAEAIEAMGQLSLTELAKGLGAVTVSLVLLVKATAKMPAGGMIGIGVGLMAVAVALRIMAEAVEAFGEMDLRTLGTGLGAVGASLVIIGLAMKLMPKNMAMIGLGLLLVSVGLNLIAKALESMGGMSVGEIAKSLITLAFALDILGGAMTVMTGATGGALALGVMASSLALLVPVLITLGKQSWTTIIKGLVFLAAGIAVLAGAAVLLGEAIPFMLGLGVALALIGVGVAGIGAGLWLFAAGLSMLVVALPTGIGIIIAAILELVDALPKIVKNMILGFLEIVNMIAEVAPKFVSAITAILATLLDAVIESAPKIAEAFGALLDVALQAIHDHYPDIVQAGMEMLINLIKGIRNNIGPLVTSAVNLITSFLGAIAGKIGSIVKAGLSILTAIVKGIIGGIGAIVTTVVTIIARFVSAIANNLGKIAAAGLSILVRFLKAIADNLGRVISAGADIIVNFVRGIGNAMGRIVTAAVQTVVKFCAMLGQQAQPLANAALKLIIDLLNGLSAAIDANSAEFGHAAARLGIAVVGGLAGAIRAGVGDIKNALLSLLPGPLKKFAGKLGIMSPSKVFYQFGEYMVQGLANGISETDDAHKAVESTANGIIKTFNDIFEITSPSKVTYKIGQFVGQGFAEGLKGSSDDVRNAFATLKQRLKDDIVAVREDIGAEQDRLAEMLQKKQEKLDDINDKKWKKAGEKAKAISDVQKEYAKGIKESEDAIASSEATLKKLTASQKVLNKDLKDERINLIKLADEFEKVNDKLKEAQDNLKALIKERDDYASSQKDKYAAPPEISKPLTEEIKGAREKIGVEQKKLDDLLGAGTQDLEKIADARKSLAEAQGGLDELVKGKVLTEDGGSVDVVKTYLQDLNAQQNAIAAYGETLEALRGMKLDDKTYRMLVEEGVAAQGFAEALLAGGKTAVKSVNKLDTDVATEANKLAVSSAGYLYDAGIKTAEGFVKGFEKDRDSLLTKVGKLGKDIIKQFKKALGIKSPSAEFAEIGKFSMEGLATGFTNSKKIVADAIDDAAKGALSAMKKSMSDISNAVTDELNPNPVITPILDLTQVRAQGEELAALTTVTPITAAASYGQASLISSGQTAAQAEEFVGAPVGPSVKFEQNNYSPEALSDIEIYRQTKNQLSQLKSVLAIT